jgi:hypothetical protein
VLQGVGRPLRFPFKSLRVDHPEPGRTHLEPTDAGRVLAEQRLRLGKSPGVREERQEESGQQCQVAHRGIGNYMVQLNIASFLSLFPP